MYIICHLSSFKNTTNSTIIGDASGFVKQWQSLIEYTPLHRFQVKKKTALFWKNWLNMTDCLCVSLLVYSCSCIIIVVITVSFCSTEQEWMEIIPPSWCRSRGTSRLKKAKAGLLKTYRTFHCSLFKGTKRWTCNTIWMEVYHGCDSRRVGCTSIHLSAVIEKSI